MTGVLTDMLTALTVLGIAAAVVFVWMALACLLTVIFNLDEWDS